MLPKAGRAHDALRAIDLYPSSARWRSYSFHFSSTTKQAVWRVGTQSIYRWPEWATTLQQRLTERRLQ